MCVCAASPKTRRFAQQQRARVDDPLVVAVLRAVFGSLAPNDPLLEGGVVMFRRRWDAQCAQLGLLHAAPHGVTPAVLRGSGANHLYRCRVPICDIAWRGRWRQIRNLEFYLQEVAGTDLLQNLAGPMLERIGLLASASGALVRQLLLEGAVASQCSSSRAVAGAGRRRSHQGPAARAAGNWCDRRPPPGAGCSWTRPLSTTSHLRLLLGRAGGDPTGDPPPGRRETSVIAAPSRRILLLDEISFDDSGRKLRVAGVAPRALRF